MVIIELPEIPKEKEIPAELLCWKSNEGYFRVAQPLIGIQQFNVVIWNPIAEEWQIFKTFTDIVLAIEEGEQIEQEWIRFSKLMNDAEEQPELADILKDLL